MSMMVVDMRQVLRVQALTMGTWKDTVAGSHSLDSWGLLSEGLPIRMLPTIVVGTLCKDSPADQEPEAAMGSCEEGVESEV